jgi:hypothetical protein
LGEFRLLEQDANKQPQLERSCRAKGDRQAISHTSLSIFLGAEFVDDGAIELISY